MKEPGSSWRVLKLQSGDGGRIRVLDVLRVRVGVRVRVRRI